MRHDKRDDDGKYRDRSPAETRGERAKMLTQTHVGRFTHERDADERRESFEVTCYDAPRFRNHRVNRNPFRVGKY